MKLHEKINELQKYSELEGTEIGEFCTILCQIAQYPDYMTDEFFAAIEKEIDAQLDNFKTNATIVETPKTVTHTIVELEWKNK